MIDIAEWRARIGAWNVARGNNICTLAARVRSQSQGPPPTSTTVMLLAVIIFITTLAAGDIEMNPGPNCAICGAAFSKGYRLFYPRASSAACLDETVGTHQPFQLRLQPTQLYQDLEAVVGRGELAVTSSCGSH